MNSLLETQETKTQFKLKSCPFCGQQHEILRAQDFHWGCGWFISCNHRVIMQAYNKLELAKMVEHWNTRPVEDALRAERDEVRTLANQAARALAQITEYTGVTFDPMNPDLVAERAIAEITELRAEIARLVEIMQTPAAVELNLKMGRMAMPRGLHWDDDNEITLRNENARLQARIMELEAAAAVYQAEIAAFHAGHAAYQNGIPLSDSTMPESNWASWVEGWLWGQWLAACDQPLAAIKEVS